MGGCECNITEKGKLLRLLTIQETDGIVCIKCGTERIADAFAGFGIVAGRIEPMDQWMGLTTILFKMHAPEKNIPSITEHTMMGGLVAMPFARVKGRVTIFSKDFRQTDQGVGYHSTILWQSVDQATGEQHGPAGYADRTLVATHHMSLRE
jgi:hypothetical protein